MVFLRLDSQMRWGLEGCIAYLSWLLINYSVPRVTGTRLRLVCWPPPKKWSRDSRLMTSCRCQVRSVMLSPAATPAVFTPVVHVADARSAPGRSPAWQSIRKLQRPGVGTLRRQRRSRSLLPPGSRQPDTESLDLRDGATRTTRSVCNVMAWRPLAPISRKCACAALSRGEEESGRKGGDALRRSTLSSPMRTASRLLLAL